MIRLNNATRLSSLAMLLASNVVLIGQSSESGQITGKVTNSKDQTPIVGALIKVEAAQLIQPRMLRTDATGAFRAMLLPPGDYKITVSADRYQGKSATGVRVGLGAQLRQDFLLNPIDFTASAVVEVTASAGTADKADPKHSVNFSAEILNALPATDRSFQGAVDLAPGAVVGSMGAGFATIRGGKTATAQYNLNGTTVGDEVAGAAAQGNGTSTQYLVDDSVEDTQVILSPLHGKYGRTGSGVINVATKSGGNEFAGTLRFYLTRNDWRAMTPYASGQQMGGQGLAVLGAGTGDDFYGNRNMDIFISGPIWKDHIWFAASTIKSPKTTATIQLNAGNPGTWQMPTAWNATNRWAAGHTLSWVTGTQPATPTNLGGYYAWDNGTTINSENTANFYQGKLTWAINPDHTVQAERSYYNQAITFYNAFGFSGIVISMGGAEPTNSQTNSLNNLSYKGILSNNLFLDVAVSQKDQYYSNGAATTLPHVRLYRATGQVWPYGTNINGGKIQNAGNDSGSFNLKWVTEWRGSHEVDFGYQYYESRHTTQGLSGYNNERFYVYGATGNAALLAAAGVTTPDAYGDMVGFMALNWTSQAGLGAGAGTGLAPMRRAYTSIDGIVRTRDEGVYVTDVYQPNNNWTILGALRMDKIRVTDADGSVAAQYWATPSPRLSVKYDLKGNSDHIFSGSVAKFVEGISAAYIEEFTMNSASDYQNLGWSANPTDKFTWVSYAQLLNPANYTYVISSQNAQVQNIKKDMSSPYIMEYTLGYRRNRANGSYFSLQLVNKEWFNDLIIEQNTSLAKLNAYVASGFTQIPDDWVVSGRDANGQTTYGLPRVFRNSNEIRRNYKAVEIELREVVSPRLTFGASYSYSRLTGNDNGGDNGGNPGWAAAMNSALAKTVSDSFYFNSLLEAQGIPKERYAPYGPLTGDQTHKARVHMTYSVPIGTSGFVSFGLLGRYDSGTNYSAIDGWTGGSNGAGFNLGIYDRPAGWPSTAPSDIINASWAPYYSGRGAFHHNDVKQLDLTINFAIPLAWKFQLVGKIDCFNILNRTGLNGTDNRNDVGYYSSFAGATNPNAPGLSTLDPSLFATGYQGPGYGNAIAFTNGRYWAVSMGLKF